MANWTLIACLKALFAAFDTIAPDRDHASDGSIGDTAHQQEVSDHNPDETGSVPIHDADHTNEVHAIDVDNNLNESDLTMEKVVQFLLGRCRSGAEKRLRYIIWNRRIWKASNDWRQETYTGPSQHTEHAHFSASYDSKNEADTSSWHLEDIPVALTTADKAAIKAMIPTTDEVAAAVWKKIRTSPETLSDTEKNELVDRTSKEVLEQKLAGTSVPGNTYERGLVDLVPDLWQLVFTGHTKGGDPIPAAGAYGQILAELVTLNTQIAALKAATLKAQAQ